MSRSIHADAIEHVGYELRERIAEDAELASQMHALSQHPLPQLERFRGANRDIVRQVAAGTRAEGTAVLAELSPEDRFWTIAAAAQLAFETAAVLRAVDRELRPAQPHRHMVQSVQNVLEAPLQNDDWLWPFPAYRSPTD